MTAYAISFLAAAVIGNRASASSGKRKIVLTLFACFPLALLAGLRSWSVGIDTSGYPLVGFYVSQSGGPLDVRNVTKCEIGFSILIWFLSVSTHDFNAVLFCIQSIMLILLAMQLIRLDSKHIGTALFVYACIFLPWSFNLMRQALAASLLLLAYQFAQERRPALFALTVLVAASIHRVAILGLVVWPIYAMANSENRHARTMLLAVAFAFLAFLVVFISFGDILLDLLSNIKASYSGEVLGDGRFNVLFTLYPLLLAVLGLFETINSKQSPENREAGRAALTVLMAFAGCASLMSLLSQTLFRIAYMFLVFAPLQVNRLLNSILSNSTRRVMCVAIIFTSAFVFVWAYCWGNASGAYPYRSDILGIV